MHHGQSTRPTENCTWSSQRTQVRTLMGRRSASPSRGTRNGVDDLVESLNLFCSEFGVLESSSDSCEPVKAFPATPLRKRSCVAPASIMMVWVLTLCQQKTRSERRLTTNLSVRSTCRYESRAVQVSSAVESPKPKVSVSASVGAPTVLFTHTPPISSSIVRLPSHCPGQSQV